MSVRSYIIDDREQKRFLLDREVPLADLLERVACAHCEGDGADRKGYQDNQNQDRPHLDRGDRHGSEVTGIGYAFRAG